MPQHEQRRKSLIRDDRRGRVPRRVVLIYSMDGINQHLLSNQRDSAQAHCRASHGWVVKPPAESCVQRACCSRNTLRVIGQWFVSYAIGTYTEAMNSIRILAVKALKLDPHLQPKVRV
ncbi:MAG TPA: hypothetical protein ENO09_02870 [bacterium]|nr:hypothetical protein [bacterium]